MSLGFTNEDLLRVSSDLIADLAHLNIRQSFFLARVHAVQVANFLLTLCCARCT